MFCVSPFFINFAATDYYDGRKLTLNKQKYRY